MSWPELQKAKRNAITISNEIEKLLKEHNSLLKKEIVRNSEKLNEDVSESIIAIEDEYKEMLRNIKNHKKQVEAKARFLKRHTSRHMY